VSLALSRSGLRTTFCALLLAAGPLLGADAAGRVTVRFIDGRPVVDGVFVSGHGPYRFLVDTATTSNHIEPALARSIGLKATFRSELTTSLSVLPVLGCDGIEVALGPARADGQTFLLAGMETVHRLSANIQGILGQNFLSRFDYLLDVHGSRLEFGASAANAKGMRVQFRSQNGRAVVATSLGELAVDSGVNQVMLFGVAAKEMVARLFTLAGSGDVGMVSGRRLQIQGRTFWWGEAVAVPNPAETEIAGLLPVSVFRRVYISNSDGYVIFE